MHITYCIALNNNPPIEIFGNGHLHAHAQEGLINIKVHLEELLSSNSNKVMWMIYVLIYITKSDTSLETWKTRDHERHIWDAC